MKLDDVWMRESCHDLHFSFHLCDLPWTFVLDGHYLACQKLLMLFKFNPFNLALSKVFCLECELNLTKLSFSYVFKQNEVSHHLQIRCVIGLLVLEVY